MWTLRLRLDQHEFEHQFLQGLAFVSITPATIAMHGSTRLLEAVPDAYQ